MADHAYAEIEFEKYYRWLTRVMAKPLPFIACDSEGKLLWCNEGNDCENTLAKLQVEQFDWACQGDGMQRHDVDHALSLLYFPVLAKGNKRIGWLAVMAASPKSDVVPVEWDQIAEVFEDISAAISDEYRLKSELNGMAQELSERYEELHLVYNIDEQIKKHDKNEDLFNALLRNCAEHLNADVVAFVSPVGGMSLAVENLSKPIHNLDLVLVEMRGDLFRFVNSSKQTVVMNDKLDARRSYIFTDMPYKILACPIYKNRSVVSILVLLNHEHKPDFSNSDRKLGEVLANQLSTLSNMNDMLNETKQMLLAQSRFTEQMAASLIEAVEAKDPYTRGHSERVHYISMEIGRALNLPQDDLKNLYWGSLLHDVGKIGIPDAVLCKPGRLTPDEFSFIMVHPERSYEILRHIDALKDAVPGARHHQEKFDGTGYPHQLKGEDIPLHGRIIAAADTYDSITSSRAYRAGRSHEAAMKEIERVRGTQLDPKIIDVLIQVCAANPAWIAQFGIKREQEVVNG
jgi:HD-GYP domain-containing protein (c-di-GMP phosphodiesterase class II)